MNFYTWHKDSAIKKQTLGDPRQTIEAKVNCNFAKITKAKIFNKQPVVARDAQM